MVIQLNQGLEQNKITSIDNCNVKNQIQYKCKNTEIFHENG